MGKTSSFREGKADRKVIRVCCSDVGAETLHLVLHSEMKCHFFNNNNFGRYNNVLSSSSRCSHPNPPNL